MKNRFIISSFIFLFLIFTIYNISADIVTLSPSNNFISISPTNQIENFVVGYLSVEISTTQPYGGSIGGSAIPENISYYFVVTSSSFWDRNTDNKILINVYDLNHNLTNIDLLNLTSLDNSRIDYYKSKISDGNYILTVKTFNNNNSNISLLISTEKNGKKMYKNVTYNFQNYKTPLTSMSMLSNVNNVLEKWTSNSIFKISLGLIIFLLLTIFIIILIAKKRNKKQK